MTELCGELWLETGSPFLNTGGDDMTEKKCTTGGWVSIALDV